MLSAIEQTGKISIVKRNFSWGEDLALIIRTVERHFSDFNGNGFYPHPEEEALQRELLNVPTLRRLADAIGREAVRGMAITDLGLSHLSEAHRNAVLYAIALTRGFPTSTDQRTKLAAASNMIASVARSSMSMSAVAARMCSSTRRAPSCQRLVMNFASGCTARTMLIWSAMAFVMSAPSA